MLYSCCSWQFHLFIWSCSCVLCELFFEILYFTHSPFSSTFTCLCCTFHTRLCVCCHRVDLHIIMIMLVTHSFAKVNKMHHNHYLNANYGLERLNLHFKRIPTLIIALPVYVNECNNMHNDNNYTI